MHTYHSAMAFPLGTVPGQDRVQTQETPAEAGDDIVLAIHHVNKMYRLYATPQDRLKQHLLGRFGKQYGREFWALRDVSFTVRRGEVFGIIGCNGSGKSTLLQIIAGVLQPTAGTVQVRGRIAALLELGSGFNMDYTGRDNIFMNGAILGIARAEMAQYLEEIIAFADIGRFIDQPVKTYSSGMFIRLAFAITTSLRMDILLIDEALAVGDIFFRQKCYQRLETLRSQGVAILLVSHAMTEVEQCCQRSLLLHHGTPMFLGPATEAVKRYYLLDQDQRLSTFTLPSQTPPPSPATGLLQTADAFWPEPAMCLDLTGKTQVSNGWARCTQVAVCNSAGEPCVSFAQGETASFFYEFELLHDIEVPSAGLEFQNDKGLLIHGKNTLEYGSEVPTACPRGTRLRFRQDIELAIATGDYTLTIGLATLPYHDYSRREFYTHALLETKLLRLCHLPHVGHFTVVLRRLTQPTQLLHHGVANLPGQCRLLAASLPAPSQA